VVVELIFQSQETTLEMEFVMLFGDQAKANGTFLDQDSPIGDKVVK